MAVDEERRFRLHQRLEEVLGPEEATALMEHLPAVGWADVATKHDLLALETRISLRFDLVDLRMAHTEERLDRMDGRLDRIDDRFDRIDDRFERLHTELRTTLVAVVAMFVTFFGSMVALIKL